MRLRYRIIQWTLAAALTGAATAAFADMQGARYEQAVLNGDSMANGGILSGAWQSSFASNLVNDLGVMQRPRPDYEAKGLPMGGFRLFPVLDLGVGSDDNVFANSAKSNDVFEDVDTSLALRSQWGRHSLAIYGGSQSQFFNKFSSENTTSWDVGTAGRLDIMGDSDLRANVYYDSLYEPRTSPNEPGAVAKPTKYSLFHSDAAWDYRPDRLGLTLGGAYDQYDYNNTPLIGGGVLDNSGRNEDVYTVYARASYDFSPGYSAFIGGSYENRNFLKAVDITGVDRDSQGYHADVGSNFFISHLVQGQVYIGYLTQNFSSPVLKDIHALDYGANVNWYATPLFTFHLGAARTIDDSTIAGVSATNDQTVYASADYELLRDLILQAEIGYTAMRFVASTRTDRQPGASLGATWLIDHNFRLLGEYQYQHRNSNVAGQQYTQNIFTLVANIQL